MESTATHGVFRMNTITIEELQAAAPNWFTSCFSYGAAFNTLDAGGLRAILDEDVIYNSQSVYEELVGKERVLWYLEGKIQTLQRSGKRAEVFMEIAGSPDGGLTPGLVVSQRSNAFEPPNKSAWLEFRYAESGLITSLCMCTVAPSPRSAFRTGFYPGR